MTTAAKIEFKAAAQFKESKAYLFTEPAKPGAPEIKGAKPAEPGAPGAPAAKADGPVCL